MDFLFHSVVDIDGLTRYYNVYRIDEAHYFAECHHFNRERICEGDFELRKESDQWKASAEKFDGIAQRIAEEIERMERTDQPV